MKNLKKSGIVFVIIIILFSCTHDDNLEKDFNSSKSDLKNNIETNRVLNRRDLPVYSKDKLIVRYAPGTSNNTKSTLRDFYGVANFKLCENCSDQSIELWIFDGIIDIEPKKTAIEQGSGGGVEAIIDVDYEFTFGIDINNPDVGTLIDTSYFSHIKPSNDGVTIAVLDTGIAPTIGGISEPVFDTRFLYNASYGSNPNVYSGWDFVNIDHNAFDDNNGRHGTVVTSIITEILNNSQSLVHHQIIPLKVCDQYGKASYFNFLCATSYGLEYADILQMSLGWYDDGFGDFLNTIVSSLIDEHPETLIVTSAGNLENNNDIRAHYPSSYSHDNIIAVAAADKSINDISTLSISNIAWFSNYGVESVDVFSKGQYIPFLGYDMSGTSFAAPVVTGVLARLKNNNPSYTAGELKYLLIASGIDCPITFDSTKKVKYNKIILP
ncbi:conserved hypothetical protein [Flavobacterium sp. 9AF]|uniref:S8 family peptidase n=1 Tax=Flavobacterium sp. 9AF TaxID=2653142 RepID=UPI0012F190AB|nr:S8 family serine peptidase [Flavobacterium sp. 9AF]VXB91845.1 conserved hypothetical protein [Flavobacterium sp. 9AF]